MHKITLPVISSCLCLILCGLVLIGWQWHIPLLTTLVPQAPPTTPLTALLLILLSSTLWLCERVVKKECPWAGWGPAVATLIILIQTLSVYELLLYVFDARGGFELLLYKKQLLSLTSTYAGRPSPRTLISVFLIGLAQLSFIALPSRPRFSSVLAFLVTGIAWVALFGYANRANPFHSFFSEAPYTGLSPVTASGFLILSAGIAGLWPRRGFLGLLLSSEPGGWIVRILLPSAVILPLFLSWITRYARELHWISLEVSEATTWAGTSMFAAIAIVWGGRIINLRYREKETMLQDLATAERSLKSTNKVYNSILEGANTGYWDYHIQQNTMYYSPGFKTLLGYADHEIKNHPDSWKDHIYPDDLQRARTLFERHVESGGAVPYDIAVRYFHKNGALLWLYSRGNVIEWNHERKPVRMVGSHVDITAIKQTELALARSEQRYQQLVNDISDYALIMLTPDGKISIWNKGAERLTGRQIEDVGGKLFRTLYPPDDASISNAQRLLARAQQKGRAEHHGWLLRPDGKFLWVHVVMTAVYNEQKEISSFSLLIHDLTEQKELERHARKSQLHFRKLMHAAPDAILICNEAGLITFANKQAERIFGHRIKELLHQPIEMLLPAHLAEKHQHHRKKYHRAPHPPMMGEASLQLLGTRKDGTTFPVEVSLSPLHTEQGILILASVRDVTEKVKIQQAIQEMNHTLEQKVKTRTKELEKMQDHLEQLVEQRTYELQQSNKELESFSYSVSHDLRAPLRAIVGFSQKLVDRYGEELPADGKRISGIIVKNALQMGQLIDDILGYSRLSRSQLQLRSVDMKQLAEEVIATLLQDTKLSAITTHVGDLPAVQGDRTLLWQVMLNLISNAIKFSKNSPNPTIEIGVHTQDNTYSFYVKDNGVGFDERHKDKLFLVFQRLHKESDFDGSGVGLAIVQRVIQRHHGRVWAESTLGQGATFNFSLPVIDQEVQPQSPKQWKHTIM